MGELTGVFVSTTEAVKWLQESRAEVYFGEVLGKHSEISGPIDDGDIELVTDDPTVIDVIEKYNLSTGYNPFDYSATDQEQFQNELGDEFDYDLTLGEVYEKINR